MSADHPGFEPWGIAEAGFPYPVGQIDLHYATDDAVSATVKLTLPTAQPTAKTVAERSVGVKDSGKLWFALECTTDAQGKVTCEAVLRGRHLHAYPEHGETDIGPELKIVLSAADMAGFVSRQVLGKHHEHLDSLMVMWVPMANGTVICSLNVGHMDMNEAELMELRERWKREAKYSPMFKLQPPPPDTPSPAPTPPPPPRPIEPGHGN